MVSAGRYGQGRGTHVGWASLGSFCGLWGTKTVSSCLEPGPGVIRAGGEWPGV